MGGFYRFLVSMVLVFCCVVAVAQKIVVSGYIVEHNGNERLIGASVFEQNSKKGCSTNEQGFFSITLPAGECSFKVSFIGYSSYTWAGLLKGDTTMQITLQPQTELNEVVVSSTRQLPVPQVSKLNSTQLMKLPVLVGEPDVLKTLQYLPGVQSGSEGSTGFSVYGGDEDQNLILLDGVTVYNPNHLFGFFSIFNDQAIQDIAVYKGNFPAKFGGRLSSVVDIQTKEGNANHICGSASVGILASTLNLEGPVVKDKLTFFVSGRKSYLNLFATPIVQHFTEFNAANYSFYDYNAKLTFKANARNKVIFSHYHSSDYGSTNSIDNEESFSSLGTSSWEEVTEWKNNLYSLSWNSALSANLHVNTIVNISRYSYGYSSNTGYSYSELSDKSSNRFTSNVKDNGLRSDFTWYAPSNQIVHFGVSVNQMEMIPGVEQFRLNGFVTDGNVDTTVGYKKLLSKEASVYAYNEIRLFDKLTIQPGVRFTLYNSSKNHFSFDPRVSVQYQFTNQARIRSSFAISHQFNHLLGSSRISQSTDIWVPSVDNIQPERAQQLTLGFDLPITDDLTFSTEAYYKTMDHLIEYKEGASFTSLASSWAQNVTFGTGYSTGVSFTLEKKTGRTTGWITYTASKSRRKFSEINSGNEYPYTYDRPHDFKAVVMHSLTKHIDISGAWVFHSGSTQTLGTTKSFIYFVNMSKNSYRLPDYHRLDVNANFHITRKHVEHIISIGAYNVYNRKNTYNLELYSLPKSSDSGELIYKVREHNLFPIIPSLTYRLRVF